METLLRFLTLRNFLIAGVLTGGIMVADRYQEYPRGWWEHRMNERARGVSPLGADIAKDLEAKESARLKALHRTVSDEIAAARAKGFKVDRLQPIADQALQLDTPAYRPAAMERLNKLRLVIPQAVEPFRPAADGDEASDMPSTPRSTTKRARSR